MNKTVILAASFLLSFASCVAAAECLHDNKPFLFRYEDGSTKAYAPCANGVQKDGCKTNKEPHIELGTDLADVATLNNVDELSFARAVVANTCSHNSKYMVTLCVSGTGHTDIHIDGFGDVAVDKPPLDTNNCAGDDASALSADMTCFKKISRGLPSNLKVQDITHEAADENIDTMDVTVFAHVAETVGGETRQQWAGTKRKLTAVRRLQNSGGGLTHGGGEDVPSWDQVSNLVDATVYLATKTSTEWEGFSGGGKNGFDSDGTSPLLTWGVGDPMVQITLDANEFTATGSGMNLVSIGKCGVGSTGGDGFYADDLFEGKLLPDASRAESQTVLFDEALADRRETATCVNGPTGVVCGVNTPCANANAGACSSDRRGRLGAAECYASDFADDTQFPKLSKFDVIGGLTTSEWGAIYDEQFLSTSIQQHVPDEGEYQRTFWRQSTGLGLQGYCSGGTTGAGPFCGDDSNCVGAETCEGNKFFQRGTNAEDVGVPLEVNGMTRYTADLPLAALKKSCVSTDMGAGTTEVTIAHRFVRPDGEYGVAQFDLEQYSSFCKEYTFTIDESSSTTAISSGRYGKNFAAVVTATDWLQCIQQPTGRNWSPTCVADAATGDCYADSTAAELAGAEDGFRLGVTVKTSHKRLDGLVEHATQGLGDEVYTGIRKIHGDSQQRSGSWGGVCTTGGAPCTIQGSVDSCAAAGNGPCDNYAWTYEEGDGATAAGIRGPDTAGSAGEWQYNSVGFGIDAGGATHTVRLGGQVCSSTASTTCGGLEDAAADDTFCALAHPAQCTGGLDGAGAACILNTPGTACEVATGDCAFFAAESCNAAEKYDVQEFTVYTDCIDPRTAGTPTTCNADAFANVPYNLQLLFHTCNDFRCLAGARVCSDDVTVYCATDADCAGAAATCVSADATLVALEAAAVGGGYCDQHCSLKREIQDANDSGDLDGAELEYSAGSNYFPLGLSINDKSCNGVETGAVDLDDDDVIGASTGKIEFFPRAFPSLFEDKGQLISGQTLADGTAITVTDGLASYHNVAGYLVDPMTTGEVEYQVGGRAVVSLQTGQLDSAPELDTMWLRTVTLCAFSPADATRVVDNLIGCGPNLDGSDSDATFRRELVIEWEPTTDTDTKNEFSPIACKFDKRRELGTTNPEIVPDNRCPDIFNAAKTSNSNYKDVSGGVGGCIQHRCDENVEGAGVCKVNADLDAASDEALAQYCGGGTEFASGKPGAQFTCDWALSLMEHREAAWDAISFDTSYMLLAGDGDTEWVLDMLGSHDRCTQAIDHSATTTRRRRLRSLLHLRRVEEQTENANSVGAFRVVPLTTNSSAVTPQPTRAPTIIDTSHAHNHAQLLGPKHSQWIDVLLAFVVFFCGSWLLVRIFATKETREKVLGIGAKYGGVKYEVVHDEGSHLKPLKSMKVMLRRRDM